MFAIFSNAESSWTACSPTIGVRFQSFASPLPTSRENMESSSLEMGTIRLLWPRAFHSFRSSLTPGISPEPSDA